MNQMQETPQLNKPEKKKEINVMLSCPSDAFEECYSSVKEAIDAFNIHSDNTNHIHLKLIHWSTDSYPESGNHPQTILNRQLTDSAEMGIAIFWKRFGTPTQSYGSGTEEEISLLTAANKQVFLYFYSKPVSPLDISSDEDIQQLRKINEYKNNYKGLYSCNSSNLESLKRNIVNDLIKFFKDHPDYPNSIGAKKRYKWYRSDTNQEISPQDVLQLFDNKVQLDGNIARFEKTLPDGNTIYSEYDFESGTIKNVTAPGFPQEYTVDIAHDQIILKKEQEITINGNAYILVYYRLKFGGECYVYYDKETHCLQQFDGRAPANKQFSIDVNTKKITLINKPN